ncbi:lipid II flippase MurJ [Sphingomonas sp.]|uniref:lipid II flippase MurJ n=1 Tax=Sphingomonas sp. TaxID=28214 RepID=UPI0025F354B2|nr:lipid II flippase MurJ [Sphingomonas sp.]
MVKQTLQLGIMSALNIGSALAFQWLVLTILGPGAQTDALFAALTVPQLFAAVISTSLTHVLTPLLAGESADDQHRDCWTLLALTTIVFLGITLVLVALAPWWIPLTVPGFSAANKALAVDLGRISLIGMIFTGLNAVQAAAAFARQRFIWTDATATCASIIAALLLVWLLPVYGVFAAAWIAVLRLLLQSLLLLRGMGRPRRPEMSRPMVSEAWRRLRPLLIGASYYKMDPLVDRFLLSALPAGSLSLLYLAQQLHSAGSQVMVKALVVPAITQLAVAAKSDDDARYSTILKRALCVMALVALFAITALAVVGKPVLALAMEHGRFAPSDSAKLWLLLMLTSGMLFGGALGSLAAGAFYARGNTRTPTWLGSISFTLSIGVKLMMFKLFGLVGLAIAISSYYLISLVMMVGSLYRRKLFDQFPLGV